MSIRCDHCGWSNNPDGAERCQKCNQELVIPRPAPVEEKKENHNAVEACCRKCGYPLASDASFCPSCGASTAPDTSSAAMKQTVRDVQPDSFQPRVTLPEVAANQPAPVEDTGKVSFRLTPMDMDVPSGTFAFGNDTDASFEYVDGQWFISDKSGNDSAYVCARRRISLQPGDVILIGNRRYRFE